MATRKQTKPGSYTVRSKTDRRRRAGLVFTREPQTVELTDEQRQAIEADPLLVIEPAE